MYHWDYVLSLKLASIINGRKRGRKIKDIGDIGDICCKWQLKKMTKTSFDFKSL